MQDLSQRVFTRIESSGIIDGINIQHVNRVLESLDDTERSPTEIARLAGVPSAMGRIILQEAEKVAGSKISNNHMRFRLSESLGSENAQTDEKSVSEKSPTASTSEETSAEPTSPSKLKDISKIIPSIIRILHERPQTISSLADELDVDQEACMMIVKNLEKENAIIEDDNTEWPEPLYRLDVDGYKKYVERASSKAKPKAIERDGLKPADSKVSDDIEKSTDKVDKKPSPVKETAKQSTDNEIVEKIVLGLLKDSDLKVSGLVKMTNPAITRVDIENAIESLMDKGLVACDNPSKRYPIYSLSDKNDSTAKKSDEKSAPSVRDDVKKPVVTTEKTSRSAAESVTKDTIHEQNEPAIGRSDFSVHSDVAALQLVLDDVLPTLSASKARQIKKAIEGIEREKSKVKNAIANLSKTINELM